jgi:hypothetical protein
MQKKRLLMSSLLLLSFSAWAQEPSGYVGWDNCANCHEKVTADWQKSRHARAFENLKKTNQATLPACIPCHVTGYGLEGGFVDNELTPNLVAVQCEECHGPGKGHAAAPGKQGITPNPGIDTCRRCHTPGQDPGFDYQKKVKNIHSGSVPVALGRARLRASPDHFDFGTIDEGIPAVTEVAVENIGDRSVVITNVRTN